MVEGGGELGVGELESFQPSLLGGEATKMCISLGEKEVSLVKLSDAASL